MRSALFHALSLDRRRPASLQHQLSDELRQGVIAGRVHPGTRLPATRRLAEALGVSRNTVLGAFAQLVAEGYLEARQGSGTFVQAALPEDALPAPSRLLGRLRRPSNPPRLSTRGQVLAQTRVSAQVADQPLVPFRPGIPALDLFPHTLWNRLHARVARRLDPALFTYGYAAGYPPLRRAIADYLRAARGVRCEWEQVIVVSGAQQALDLTARLVLDPGDPAVVEDPGYPGARAALEAAGAKLRPIGVDADGLVVDGMRPLPPARVAYVCPSHHNPLGGTLPLRRRLALLAWARKQRAWILEDDYDSEFRYRGSPLPALQGLDRRNCVLYMGTFSKVLLPALRLGYLVVPPEFIGAFTAAKALADRQTPLLEQAVLARFLEEGHFERHVRRMRTVYLERQTTLVQTISTTLGGVVDAQAAVAGLHLVGWLPAGTDDAAVSDALLRRGIECPPLSHYAIGSRPRSGLLLGYAAFTPEMLRRAVRELAAHLYGLKILRR